MPMEPINQEDEKRAILSEENRRQRMLDAVSDDERVSLYCEALLADPRITMLQILDMQSPLEVARVYVELRISEERQRRYDTPLIDEESAKNTLEDDPDVWIEEERQRRERRGEVIYDPEKAIHTFHRCVIMGDPGAGKTTLLRHLAIMAAQRSIAGTPSLLPIYVELQSFVRSGLHDLLDFVSATWEGAYALPAQQARLLLANYLDEGKALLLLDALDESLVGETPKAAEQSYEAISQSILNIAADYPKAPMVVTMRKASSRQHKPLVGFTALEVMDFRFEDVKQFVQNWYDAAHDPHAEEKAADLIKRLEANPPLQTLAANPLLLTLIVLAHEDHLDLPERRAELYRICIETLLTKSDARRGIGRRQEFKPEQKHQLLKVIAWLFHRKRQRYFTEREFKPEQKHQLLKVIAWHFHRKRQRYITEHDLLQVIAEFLPAISLPAERNHDILQEIESEQGVLKEQAPGWHGFLHLTVQEYFAAEYIDDHQNYAELLRHRADPWWEEVLLLYVGITPDASLFLQELCSENSSLHEDIFYTNLLLAGRCLTARPTVRETGLRTQIIERLFELLISSQYSLLRQEAIKVVCSIGVLETNRRLVILLSDDRLDLDLRWSIADALGRLGEPSVVADLVQLLSDDRLDVDLRRNIADALGTLGERSVTARALVQLLSDDRLGVFVRRRITNALGALGEPSVAGDLVQLLSDDWLDADLRWSIADALGRLAERSVAADLVQLLSDDRLDMDLRWSIAGALGALGERSVAADLVQLLSDDRLDVNLRRGIADTLGRLGERSVAARVMVQLLSDDRLGVFMRRKIADALGALGERSVAADLVQLLSDERLHAFIRRKIVDALGTLGEHSVAGDLVQLLSDDQLGVNLRRGIASALAAYANDISIVEGLIKLLQDKEISDSVYTALWAINRRVGVWIFPMRLTAHASNVKQSQAHYEVVPWE
jgi:HEAT repeat protein/energy-coupling factor transporter ATP-binding protein EcfA2